MKEAAKCTDDLNSEFAGGGVVLLEDRNQPTMRMENMQQRRKESPQCQLPTAQIDASEPRENTSLSAPFVQSGRPIRPINNQT